jgi:uncharacterized protein YjlB
MNTETIFFKPSDWVPNNPHLPVLDFQVIGAYSKGQHADIQTSAASTEMLAKISSGPLPHTDPVQEPSGFLIEK